MQILSKNNLLLLEKRILVILGLFIGLFFSIILLKAIFNLGVYTGTFIRCLYNIVC